MYAIRSYYANKNGIPHPNIITESGRSLTAHHSVLIFEVLESATLPTWDEDVEIHETDHELVKELYDIWDNLNGPRMLEAWHDSQQIREEALDRFSLGLLDLKTRAQIERFVITSYSIHYTKLYEFQISAAFVFTVPNESSPSSFKFSSACS